MQFGCRFIILYILQVLRPFLLRRLKKDVEAELPDKVEHIIKCPMSALQSHLYSLLQKKSVSHGSSGIRRFNNTIMQLRKLCNHPFVFEEVERLVNPSHTNNPLLFRTSGKFHLLQRMLSKLKTAGHRILIFFQMTTVMTIMEDFLTMEGHSYLRLDGSTKAEDRSSLLKRFNDPSSPYFVFLLSTRAGGLGLNLQSADTVILFDSDWNPHQDLQAQDRAHRIGQTKQVRIFRLVTVDSVEEVILAKAQYKLSLDGKVIQAGKFDHKSTSEEREALLRAILETEQKGSSESSGAIYTDEELNEVIARGDDEKEVFCKLDEEMTRYSLMQENELPDIYLNEFVEEDGGTEADSGRSRSNRRISYEDDLLTDAQWLKVDSKYVQTRVYACTFAVLVPVCACAVVHLYCVGWLIFCTYCVNVLEGGG